MIGRRTFLTGALASAASAPFAGTAARALDGIERRDEVSFLRGPYNLAFYYRLNKAYRIGAGMPGSLHDALMQAAPGMMAMPGSTEPGEVPAMMVERMVQAWKAKAARMPDVAPIDMTVEPSLGPARVAAR